MLVATTSTNVTDSFCPVCGVLKRSGKTSCCGVGGSWFGNCGVVDHTKRDHTWSDGRRVCASRAPEVVEGQLSHVLVPEATIGHQLHRLAPNDNIDNQLRMLVPKHNAVVGYTDIDIIDIVG